MINTIGKKHIKLIKEKIEYLCRQPLDSVFRKYANSAKELSSRFNKMIKVDLVGTQLEVSYQRFESLFGSLVHLIRNSIDHGLETPDIRNMLGKPETGNLTIEAQRTNGRLILRISDDGAGIDPEKIKQIAITKGLIDQETAGKFKEDEIIDLIFAPGFSTHEQVTNVSGRGVGMDAVKNAVEELDGNINILTQIDQGTTFELSFPE
jgi:two-component system chemotaxis sensor kinase CheA